MFNFEIERVLNIELCLSQSQIDELPIFELADKIQIDTLDMVQRHSANPEIYEVYKDIIHQVAEYGKERNLDLILSVSDGFSTVNTVKHPAMIQIIHEKDGPFSIFIFFTLSLDSKVVLHLDILDREEALEYLVIGPESNLIH